MIHHSPFSYLIHHYCITHHSPFSYWIQVVHGAIRTANLTGRSILPEQARKEIFLNIGEIYALSFDLLQELEDRLSNWSGQLKFSFDKN